MDASLGPVSGVLEGHVADLEIPGVADALSVDVDLQEMRVGELGLGLVVVGKWPLP